MAKMAQTVRDVIVCTNGVLSQILNAFLIFIIVKYSKTNMGSYKYLMVIFAAFEMFYSLVQVAVHPEYMLHKRMLIVFYNGIFVENMSRFHQHLLICWFAGIFCQSLIILCYHFIYRYIAVCRFNLDYVWSAPRWIAFWFFLYWAVTGTWFGMCIGLLEMRKVKDDLGYEEMKKNFNISIYERGYTGPLYYYNNHWVLSDCVGMAVVVLILFSCTTCIVVCAILIPRRLNIAEMSTRTKTLQRQLFKVLLLQTVIPLLSSQVPIAIVFLGPVFGLQTSIGYGVSALTTYFPVIDPLISLCFIKDYRCAITQLMCVRSKRVMNYRTGAQTGSNSGHHAPPFKRN